MHSRMVLNVPDLTESQIQKVNEEFTSVTVEGKLQK